MNELGACPHDQRRLRRRFAGTKAYDNYHNFVYGYFQDRKKDLLVLDLKENNKWEKLCTFLDKKLIIKNYPFLNSR